MSLLPSPRKTSARVEIDSREPPLAAPPSRLITFRAILIGSLLVALTAALTPYNDYVVYNTLLVGSYFPPIVVLSLFVLVLLVNAPLRAIRPLWAFSTGELSVILTMLLVGCCVPGQGLVRVFLPTLVSPFRYAGTDAIFGQRFASAGIPAWLFPVNPADGPLSRVVTEFYGRTAPGAMPPYVAWVLPIAIWSIFFVGMYMALLSLAALLRNQWAHNERLPFPLAQLELELIQEPQKGRWVNEVLSRRSFWIAAGVVLFVHLLNGLHIYFPRQVPEIPLAYDIQKLMTEEPWASTSMNVKKSTIYFTLIGVMYFIPLRVGFSLWGMFILLQASAVIVQATTERTLAGGAWNDEHLGASVVFLLGVAWIGRRHWATVTRHVFKGAGPDEPVSYRKPAIFLGIGTTIMFLWLLAVGMHAQYALLALTVGLLAHLVVARVVAETGLPIFRSTLTPGQIVTTLPASAVSPRDVFFSGVFGMLGAWTTRESPTAMSLHGMRITDEQEPTPRTRRGLMALMVWSVLLAFSVSCCSALYCYYHFATPLAATVQTLPLNDYAAVILPRTEIVEPMLQQGNGRFAGKAHDPTTHRLIGASVMAVLQIGAWLSASWPLAPVGYLVGTTNFIHQVWWSIFLGWLAKAMVVRFGGFPMYRRARPVFIGLILGEGLAATFWLIASFILASTGHDYSQIRLLPV